MKELRRRSGLSTPPTRRARSSRAEHHGHFVDGDLRADAVRTWSCASRDKAGFAVSSDGAEVVALDLTLTEELRRRGYLRDVVRQVQDVRKNSGLDVAIASCCTSSVWTISAMDFDTLASEVLAREVLTRRAWGKGRRSTWTTNATPALGREGSSAKYSIWSAGWSGGLAPSRSGEWPDCHRGSAGEPRAPHRISRHLRR